MSSQPPPNEPPKKPSFGAAGGFTFSSPPKESASDSGAAPKKTFTFASNTPISEPSNGGRATKPFAFASPPGATSSFTTPTPAPAAGFGASVTTRFSPPAPTTPSTTTTAFAAKQGPPAFTGRGAGVKKSTTMKSTYSDIPFAPTYSTNFAPAPIEWERPASAEAVAEFHTLLGTFDDAVSRADRQACEAPLRRLKELLPGVTRAQLDDGHREGDRDATAQGDVGVLMVEVLQRMLDQPSLRANERLLIIALEIACTTPVQRLSPSRPSTALLQTFTRTLRDHFSASTPSYWLVLCFARAVQIYSLTARRSVDRARAGEEAEYRAEWQTLFEAVIEGVVWLYEGEVSSGDDQFGETQRLDVRQQMWDTREQLVNLWERLSPAARERLAALTVRRMVRECGLAMPESDRLSDLSTEASEWWWSREELHAREGHRPSSPTVAALITCDESLNAVHAFFDAFVTLCQTGEARMLSVASAADVGRKGHYTSQANEGIAATVRTTTETDEMDFDRELTRLYRLNQSPRGFMATILARLLDVESSCDTFPAPTLLKWLRTWLRGEGARAWEVRSQVALAYYAYDASDDATMRTAMMVRCDHQSLLECLRRLGEYDAWRRRSGISLSTSGKESALGAALRLFYEEGQRVIDRLVYVQYAMPPNNPYIRTADDDGGKILEYLFEDAGA